MSSVSSATVAPSFTKRLVDWQRTHGRHHLPWQNTRDAYRIWLSEIMLQQTQVATALPYYERFLTRFPDVWSLASATEDDVLTLWAGLGYYSRARNLHKAAQQIVDQYEGIFPNRVDQLAELPGIGRSTAAAIAAFAYDVIAPILDGNVKRVIARHAGVDGFPGATPIARQLWLEAGRRLPVETADIVAYTQGIMDLGASVCGRSTPRCSLCPVAADCIAYCHGRTEEIPAPRPAKVLPQRTQRYLLALHENRVLLVKRPAPGIWGGLWCLPELAIDESAVTTLKHRFNADGEACERTLTPFQHSFTHFKLSLLPQLVNVHHNHPQVSEEGSTRWLLLAHLDTLALPTPILKILRSVNTGVLD